MKLFDCLTASRKTNRFQACKRCLLKIINAKANATRYAQAEFVQ